MASYHLEVAGERDYTHTHTHNRLENCLLEARDNRNALIDNARAIVQVVVCICIMKRRARFSDEYVSLPVSGMANVARCRPIKANVGKCAQHWVPTFE